MISLTRYRTAAQIRRQTELGQQIAELQDSVSSGKRITKPSDDPQASQRVSEIRQSQADQAIWSNNIDMATSIASAVDSNLGDMADSLNRAKELILSGRNDTTSAIDRSAIAQELRSIAADFDSKSVSSDPTGAPLFPAGTPNSFPISDTLNLPVTASRTVIFGNVSTASGTKTLQQILNDAADAIQSTTATRAADVQSGLDEIDAGFAHITSERTDHGVRAARFDEAKTDLESSEANLSEERSGLESTDLTYALAEFQSKQTALQAAQTLYARANSKSLFDLLG